LSGSLCFDALLLDAAPPALAGGSVTEFSRRIAQRMERDRTYRLMALGALLAPAAVAVAQNIVGTIVPTPEVGQTEIRDNLGMVRGYLRPNQATGQTEILDSVGRVKGYISPGADGTLLPFEKTDR
jgi:hypothetical protein